MKAPPVRTRTVPFGTIAYFDKPYHRYELGEKILVPWVGEKVPSVTQAIGVLDKSRPLISWATRIDVAAALELAVGGWRRCPRGGCPAQYVPIHTEDEVCESCNGSLYAYSLPHEGWQLQRDIQLAHIDHNYVVGESQVRGTTIHKLHEDWVNERKPPNPGEHRLEWRGYVRSYARFLMDHRELGFESAEVLVGSKEHGFAGTCDTVAVVQSSAGRSRLDFKTSKDVYPSSHFPQLMGYEIGAVECGDEPTDRQGIVRLGDDGSYEIKYPEDYGLTVKPDDFLVLLNAFKSQKPFKDAERRAYNAKRKKARA